MTLEPALAAYFETKGNSMFEKRSHFFKSEYHKKILHLEIDDLVRALVLLFKYNMLPSFNLKQPPSEMHIRRYLEIAESVKPDSTTLSEDKNTAQQRLNNRRAAIYLLASTFKQDPQSTLVCKPNPILIDKDWKSVQSNMQDTILAVKEALGLKNEILFETKEKKRSETPNGTRQTNPTMLEIFGFPLNSPNNREDPQNQDAKSDLGGQKQTRHARREGTPDNIKSPIGEPAVMDQAMAEEFNRMFKRLGVEAESPKPALHEAFLKKMTELLKAGRQLDEFVGELLARLGSPQLKPLCASYFKIEYNDLSSIFEKITVLQTIFREDGPHAEKDWSSLALSVFYASSTDQLKILLEGVCQHHPNPTRMDEIKKLAMFQSSHYHKKPSTFFEAISKYLCDAFDNENGQDFIDHLDAFQSNIGI